MEAPCGGDKRWFRKVGCLSEERLFPTRVNWCEEQARRFSDASSLSFPLRDPFHTCALSHATICCVLTKPEG